MPADYQSTARALAIPVDDDDSPLERSRSPLWRRHSRRFSRRRSVPDRQTSYRDRLLYHTEKLQRHALATYRKLSPVQRILLILAGIVTMVLGILFLVFNERIFGWLKPLAQKWRDIPAGWLILWFAVFFVSFPPLIGYSTCTTLAGFVFGLPAGWLIVATATVLGSTASFVVSRTVLSGFVNRLVANDKRFTALSLTLKHDGLKILVMIRLCPLPYSISNGALATFPTIHWSRFMAATALATPRLLINVFIGTRLAAVAGEMDTKTRLINYGSIALGAIVGLATGLIIYRQTKKRAEQLEEEEREHAHSRPSSRLRREYSDDPGERDLADSLRDQDEISLRETDIDDAYRDMTSDEEEDVFKHGDGDEEEGRDR